MKFTGRKISDLAYEAASAFDVNNDGHKDIICGKYWYEGPDFVKKHEICDVLPDGEYFDDFSDYGMDVNGDGFTDIITGGWGHKTLRWRENPGNDGLWTVHDIDVCGNIETIRYFDIDGCGVDEIFPNTPNDPLVCYKLIVDENGKGTGKFEKYTLFDKPLGHGLGFGDVNGDGKIEIICLNGFLTQPEGGVFTGTWTLHEEFKIDVMASVPILCCDVTGNGVNDIIVGNAHGYGLYWWEQLGNGKWEKHIIDESAAQYHDMMLVDIDDDGELELLTGKRYRAHCGNDPGDNDDVGIYYFKFKNGVFEKNIIDYGTPGEHSGLGIYFWYEDINNDGIPEIIAPGKEGLFIFQKVEN